MHVFSKAALASLLALAFSNFTSVAQAQVTVNINPPAWGPAAPAGTQYYYIPEVGGYYDLHDRQYVVYRNNGWARVAALPGYSPAAFHPVVINYVGAQPWILIREHKLKYPKPGHPHGMPPGQAKKMRGAYPVVGPGYGPVYVEEKHGKEHGHGKGHGHGRNKHDEDDED